jgi:hypothetical protein
MRVNRATYGQMQFQLALARAAAWQARVTSGGYRLSRMQRAGGKNEDGSLAWRDCTDDEKLQDAIATMDRHLHMAQEILDATEIGDGAP